LLRPLPDVRGGRSVRGPAGEPGGLPASRRPDGAGRPGRGDGRAPGAGDGGVRAVGVPRGGLTPGLTGWPVCGPLGSWGNEAAEGVMSQPPEVLGPGSPVAHGYQGDRGAAPAPRAAPAALTVTVSRESGARGGTIARRVARKLGWQVYDQELLEFMASDGVAR